MWMSETRSEPFRFFSPEESFRFQRKLYSHEILVPGLAELDQIRFDAVHLLVDLSVVGCLFLQIFLQSTFAVHDFTDPRF